MRARIYTFELNKPIDSYLLLLFEFKDGKTLIAN